MDYQAIEKLDNWLDDHVSPAYKEQPLAQDWARLSKIGEEYGEAVDAFIGVTGQNPRKGFYGNQEDVDEELADIFLTALLCLQHRTKDIVLTEDVIRRRIEYRLRKAGLSEE